MEVILLNSMPYKNLISRFYYLFAIGRNADLQRMNVHNMLKELFSRWDDVYQTSVNREFNCDLLPLSAVNGDYAFNPGRNLTEGLFSASFLR